MKLTFRGDWPDPVECDLLAQLVVGRIPDGERWVVRLVRGDEQVLTTDPVRVGGPGTGPMRVLTPAEMRLRPRYVFWNRARRDMKFSASLPLALLFQIVMWYAVGPDAIAAVFVGASVPSA
jgi:hypothetical protein